jgi:hypothetical protein
VSDSFSRPLTLSARPLLEAAERLLQAVEQREHAELGVFAPCDEVGLLHGDLGAQRTHSSPRFWEPVTARA